MAALLLPWGCNLKNNWAGQAELVVLLNWFCSHCKFTPTRSCLFWSFKFSFILFSEFFWWTCGIELEGTLEKAAPSGLCKCPLFYARFWHLFFSQEGLGPVQTQQVSTCERASLCLGSKNPFQIGEVVLRSELCTNCLLLKCSCVTSEMRKRYQSRHERWSEPQSPLLPND